MSSELRRVLEFEEGLRDRCVERALPFRFGLALFTDTLPQVWELNLLRVERSGGTNAGELADEAERLQGEAGLVHRRVNVQDESVGAALAPGFRELEWVVKRFVFMVAKAPTQRAADARGVVEVERELLEPLREETIREEPWGTDREVVRQLLAANKLIARAGRARHFAVLAEGTAISGADLYSDGETAQIEDVATLQEHRGRGFASAVVVRAAAEAARSGHSLTFLVADDEDWPKDLYARLGFRSVGRRYVFFKPSTSARPDGTQPRDRAS